MLFEQLRRVGGRLGDDVVLIEQLAELKAVLLEHSRHAAGLFAKHVPESRSSNDCVFPFFCSSSDSQLRLYNCVVANHHFSLGFWRSMFLPTFFCTALLCPLSSRSSRRFGGATAKTRFWKVLYSVRPQKIGCKIKQSRALLYTLTCRARQTI